MHNRSFELAPETLDGLRALRLWHWKRCAEHRKKERFASKLGLDGVSWSHYERANFHLKQVQLLNDFFPAPGDTAEADAAKEAG